MRCPTITELPPPPIGKIGWPWIEATDSLPDSMPDGQPWPKVSIVTPSYNQGEFIEETIRSVLLQGYPNLEYIVIDGGSDDESVQIIRRYEKWLAYWVSEDDSGQTHAINKGFSRSTGDVCAYLNSDDVYLPGVFHNVASFFEKHPEAGFVYGDCQLIDESSRIVDLWVAPNFDLLELLFRCYIPQQAAFWRKLMFSEVGAFDQQMHYAFDYEMWLRMARQRPLSHVSLFLSQHRKAEGTKTMAQPEAFAPEIMHALQKFFSAANLPPTLKSMEADAYAIAHMNQALLDFRLNRIEEGRQAMEIGLRQSPKVVARHRERIIRALVAHADPSDSLDHARKYLAKVFAALPENAQALRPLEQKVMRRVEILHATRSRDRQALRRARRLLLPIMIGDSAWIHSKAARREFLNVLIGHSATKRLAGLKHVLGGARSGALSTRKDYA